jgi:tagatose 6-phosphate kinase
VIVTVTLNLALDITYAIGRFDRGSTARVETVGKRAGGKGVNVARVLHALGREVIVAGLAGGLTGEAAQRELRSAGLRDELEPIAGESRTTIMITESDGAATGFSELGPRVSAAEWGRLMTRLRSLIRGADAVVVSGSLPPGVPEDAYARVIELAVERGVPVLVDAEGRALEHAVRACPALVKVNADELAGVLPGHGSLTGAGQLRRNGAEAVVISEGETGLLGDTEIGRWRASLPNPVHGNPTGAGDAAAAALITGLIDSTPWPERLADAVALSAAAVAAPLAGSFDEPLYRRLGPTVLTFPLDAE